MAWSAIITRITSLIPGVGLSIVVTLVSLAVQYLEERFLSHPYLEALVIAILLGMAVRSVWEPNPRWRPGIRRNPSSRRTLAQAGFRNTLVLTRSALHLGARR